MLEEIWPMLEAKGQLVNLVVGEPAIFQELKCLSQAI